MKTISWLVALLLSLSMAGDLWAAAPIQFTGSFSGTRKFQTTKNGKQVIASEAISAKSICAAFGVSTKDYALVFDGAAYALVLRPILDASMLPALQVMVVGSRLKTYESDSPEQELNCWTVAGGGQAGGTVYSSMQGFASFTVKRKNGDMTGAFGTFSGVATAALPDYSFIQIKFTAAKAFFPK